MAYLNSDDTLLPERSPMSRTTFWRGRMSISSMDTGSLWTGTAWKVGRAVLPAHHAQTLRYADFIPQETMFWRRVCGTRSDRSTRISTTRWTGIFLLRAQEKGFKFVRLPRFLACFRIHDQQKTTATYAVATERCATCACARLVSRRRRCRSGVRSLPMSCGKIAYHWSYKLGLLKH